MPIDTAKVQGRRALRFNSIEEMHAEVDRLTQAELAGTLTARGNWTLGQVLNHLGAWVNFPFDGYPPSINPPWIIRFIMKFQKKKYLREGLPAGVRIPNIQNGTEAIEVVPLDAGLNTFRAAWKRLAAQCPTRPNPLFGPISHEEWIAGNLRHAELHLSFFNPQ